METIAHPAGQSPETLLASYHIERSAAADENIRESTRSTDFMAPASKQEARLRQAVLSLAKDTEFGKRMINGGRLSTPSVYESPLSTPDRDDWPGGPPPGASMLDAPFKTRGGDDTFLTAALKKPGNAFSLVEFANGRSSAMPDGIDVIRIGAEADFADPSGVTGSALRRPTGNGLCDAARWLCRGAVSQPDPRVDRGRHCACQRRFERMPMPLSTSSNFANPDDAFRMIVEAHRGLGDEQSADLDAALVLVLANHIGDLDVLREAIALAKRRMVDASQKQQQQQ